MNTTTDTVKEAGLAVAVQSLGEALSPGKAIGKISNGHQEKKSPEPVAVKPITMADKVRMARENIANGGVPLSKMVDEAIGVSKDTDNVEIFMDSMAAVDKAVVELRLFASDKGEKWQNLPLARVETEVHQWAKNGNVIAQKLVGLLDVLKDVGILDILWRTYVKVVRPANEVRGYNSLKSFLESLEKAHLADGCDLNKMRLVPAKAVVVRTSVHGRVAYLPARIDKLAVPEAEKGWDWVKKAEARAVELIMDNMKKEDTGLTMGEVKASGQEGVIFLRAGTYKGALLEIRARGGFYARIVEAFGIDIETPTDWMAGNFLLRRDNWPDRDLHYAFEAWRDRG